MITTRHDTDSTENSENEFCMEVHGTEEWVWDYKNENSEENIVDGVATEHRDDDDTEADEDLYNRGVVSRVTLTTSPSLDLEDVIAEKEIQWQDIPSNKTYETNPTSVTRAEDVGMSETDQRMGTYGLDGNTVATQH